LLKFLVIAAFLFFFASRLLPRLGSLLGRSARKPFRQAQWLWSWMAGSEADAIEAERAYGRECAREFAAQFSGRAAAAFEDLVDQVGARLARAVGDPRREFRFAVAVSPRINAYALPGGFVFVTEALLVRCGGDRDEVAFLLAHEIGHILRGHARDRLTAGVFLNAVAARLPGTGRMLSEVLAKGYSRELELEADREAVLLMRAAGFDPTAAIRALQRLAGGPSDTTGVDEYFSTHPPYRERIEEVTRAMAG
jgi:beta-barrel assembly-enhancing protease